jgi:hypothetical protein
VLVPQALGPLPCRQHGPLDEVAALVSASQRIEHGGIQLVGREPLGIAVLGAVALAM